MCVEIRLLVQVLEVFLCFVALDELGLERAARDELTCRRDGLSLVVCLSLRLEGTCEFGARPPYSKKEGRLAPCKFDILIIESFREDEFYLIKLLIVEDYFMIYKCHLAQSDGQGHFGHFGASTIDLTSLVRLQISRNCVSGAFTGSSRQEVAGSSVP